MPQYVCNTWGFREVGLKETLDAVRGLGFRLVELVCTPRSGHLQPTMSDEELQVVRNMAQACGLTIVAVDGGNDFTVDDPEKLRQQVHQSLRLVDVTAALGAKVVRLFAGFAPVEAITPATYRQVGDCLSQVGEYAQKRGIAVTVENHGGITATGASCARIMAHVSSAAVGLNFDPANFWDDDEDPNVALDSILPFINYTHWKDCQRLPDGSHRYCALGQGDIDWEPLVKRLLRVYDGYYAIEYEEPSDVIEGTRISLEFLQRMVTAALAV